MPLSAASGHSKCGISSRANKPSPNGFWHRSINRPSGSHCEPFGLLLHLPDCRAYDMRGQNGDRQPLTIERLCCADVRVRLTTVDNSAGVWHTPILDHESGDIIHD